MNRFLKAGGIPAREFLESKYGKGGVAKGLGKAARGMPLSAADEIGAMGEEALRRKTAKSSPLQSLSEEDISMVSGIGFPQLRSKGKPSKAILQSYIDDALEEAGSSKRGLERFIEQFMDYGVDFDELDDIIFDAEKIPKKFRSAVENDEWPEFANLRMGYYHEIEDSIRKALKKAKYGRD